jgi:hypothetical protein
MRRATQTFHFASASLGRDETVAKGTLADDSSAIVKQFPDLFEATQPSELGDDAPRYARAAS